MANNAKLRARTGSSGNPHKYGAKRTDCRRGHSHPSRKEAGRCDELCLLESGGEIENLEFKGRYNFTINDVKICTYESDFEYIDARTGKRVVEDSKGVRTPVFIIKKKLMKAFYEIEVVET